METNPQILELPFPFVFSPWKAIEMARIGFCHLSFFHCTLQGIKKRMKIQNVALYSINFLFIKNMIEITFLTEQHLL